MADFIKNGPYYRKLFLLIHARPQLPFEVVKLDRPCLYNINLESQLSMSGHPCHTMINMGIFEIKGKVIRLNEVSVACWL